MLHFFTGLDFHTSLMLILALLFVLFYEAINGFHDTANAVTTAIYTRAIRSQFAVIIAGLFNFLGVMLGGLSVAYTIVHLLPTDLLLNIGSTNGLAMVFSMLLAAIIWNLSTWYVGLPASSSHTLIGAIVGICLTNALMTRTSVIAALNIPKMMGIILSLLLSPLLGMLVAGLVVFFLHRYWCTTTKQQHIHMTPAEYEKIDGKCKPPFWIRVALILSAIGVSFAHGANDGQKGIGLIMLVLIGIAPEVFVVNMNATGYDIIHTRDAVSHLQKYYQQHSDALPQIASLISHGQGKDEGELLNQPIKFHCDIFHAMATIELTQDWLHNLQSYGQLTVEQRSQLRCLLMCISETVDNIAKLSEISVTDRRFLKSLHQDLLKTVEYAPIWIIIAVAFSLSLGTIIGWQRVATTIGEKIGKKGMTYAQGVSAQMTAALWIGIASYTGMPVSTTHVISSAVAGTMLVEGGGIQNKTVKNILLSWLLTLPVSMLLSSFLYLITLKFFK
ncbi:inorganic phosphate transporter PitA [Candidatus Gillettellia adelgis]